MRANWLIAAALAAALGAPAVAGDGHKCTKTTQACLDAMAADMKNKGWAGMDLNKDEKTGAFTVKRVFSGTPAENAGIREGDVLVALNGIKLNDEGSKEALYAVKKTLKPGVQATYTIARDGKQKDYTVTLTRPSEEVIAGWVGSHMMEHATTAVAQN